MVEEQQGSESPSCPTLGSLLAKHREKRRLTQQELSELTRGQVSVGTIGLIERDKVKRPQRQTVDLLVRALALSGDELTAFKAAARQKPPRSPFAESERSGGSKLVRDDDLSVHLLGDKSTAPHGNEPPQDEASSLGVGRPVSGRLEESSHESPKLASSQAANSSFKRQLAIWGSVALVVAVIATTQLVRRDGAPSADNSRTATEPPSPSVLFEVPNEGDRIASPFLARGTAELPPNTALWLLTQPPDGAYYPAGTEPVAVDDSGAWVVKVSLGRDERDIGLAYDLHAVIVPTATNSLADSVRRAADTGSFARLDILPADVTPVARVHVTLGQRGP